MRRVLLNLQLKIAKYAQALSPAIEVFASLGIAATVTTSAPSGAEAPSGGSARAEAREAGLREARGETRDEQECEPAAHAQRDKCQDDRQEREHQRDHPRVVHAVGAAAAQRAGSRV